MDDIARRPSFQRRMRVLRFQARLAGALRWPHLPVLKVVWMFWATLMDEGIYQTCKPRWGAITFCYLNDGMKPTPWHTWRQMIHDHTDPFTGIYPGGAPSSLDEARTWEIAASEQRRA